MYEFAPPGLGYAYGDTIPIFKTSRLLLLRTPRADSAACALDRVPDHGPPLLRRGAFEVLAEGPPPPVGSGRASSQCGPEVVGRRSGEVGPARSNESGVVRIAGPGR